MNPHRLLDEEFYTRKYPDVKLSGIPPLDHFLKIGIHLGRMANSEDDPGMPFSDIESIHHDSDEPILGYIDFPLEKDFIGHDYIKVIGWCYYKGIEIANVTAEIEGSGVREFLRFSIFRPDVANVFRHLKFFNVGFEGELFPSDSNSKSDERNLLVSVETRSGAIHNLRKRLLKDSVITEPPVNRFFANSIFNQAVNSHPVLFPIDAI